VYELYIRPHLDSVFSKLSKKDPVTFSILSGKISEILANPFRFKPLRAPMQGRRRVHVGKSFVLVYSIRGLKVILEDFDHHDKIYQF
jgi:YafQ family addiction module toxin component